MQRRAAGEKPSSSRRPPGQGRPRGGGARLRRKNATTRACGIGWEATRSKPGGSSQISGTAAARRAGQGAGNASCPAAGTSTNSGSSGRARRIASVWLGWRGSASPSGRQSCTGTLRRASAPSPAKRNRGPGAATTTARMRGSGAKRGKAAASGTAPARIRAVAPPPRRRRPRRVRASLLPTVRRPEGPVGPGLHRVLHRGAAAPRQGGARRGIPREHHLL